MDTDWAYENAMERACRHQLGMVPADIQGVQKILMKKKRYTDLTGNLLNPPNDYLARIQAQTVAAVLKPPET